MALPRLRRRAVGMSNKSLRDFGRGEWIRTTGLLVPNQDISTTYRHRYMKPQGLRVLLLDPDWTQKWHFPRFGPWLDPAFHVGNPRAFSRTRAVASTF